MELERRRSRSQGCQARDCLSGVSDAEGEAKPGQISLVELTIVNEGDINVRRKELCEDWAGLYGKLG